MSRSFSEEYQQKLLTPEQAAGIVNSGDWVEYNYLCGKPVDFDRALAQRKDELKNVKVRCSVTLPPVPEVAKVDPTTEHFMWHSYHFSAIDRKLQDNNQAWVIPFIFHEVGRWVEDFIDMDVFVSQVTPMDKFGYFNVSIQACFALDAVKKAKKVIVEVNENLPYCCGGFDESIHISQVDYIIEGSNLSPPVLPPPSVTEAERKIAELIANDIEDGSNLQLGIGGLPNYVGQILARSDLKDLGVHSEMFCDAFLDMWKAGILTNANKNLNRFKSVYTFALGSRELYEFIDHNPGLAAYPVTYSNNPAIIAANPKMVAINNCVAVDLYSQVCSESFGFRQISGTGGQADFNKGAFDSQGGKSFLCLTSTVTDKDGNLSSRIMPTLPPGSIITVPRNLVHYLVTEYGKVCLKGKSSWERAEDLISIAHPQFQDDLVREAERMKIWRRTNKVS